MPGGTEAVQALYACAFAQALIVTNPKFANDDVGQYLPWETGCFPTAMYQSLREAQGQVAERSEVP